MKTSIKVVLVAIVFSFSSLTSFATSTIEDNPKDIVVVNDVQDSSVKGVYKGHDDSGYNFTVVDSEGNESVVTFQKGDEAVIRANDLASEGSIGKSFEVTFSVSSEKALDSEGEETMQEIRTITGLVALR